MRTKVDVLTSSAEDRQSGAVLIVCNDDACA